MCKTNKSKFLAGWIKVALFYQSTPSLFMLKSPFGLDFGTLGFGTSDSGLTMIKGEKNHLFIVPQGVWQLIVVIAHSL